MFSKQISESIRSYAMSKYPQEMCGLVIGDEFVPQENIHEDPVMNFKMSDDLWLDGTMDKTVAIVHSHTNGRVEPTGIDIQGQCSTGKIWGLVVASEDRCTNPLWWGKGVPVPPLVGRDFRHGPSGSDGRGDCYALVKDWFLLNRDIELPEFPRNSEWWMEDGYNLYLDNFRKAGFEIVLDPAPGDCFIAQVIGKVPSHAGILVDPDTILHHLSGRLSRHDPAISWRRYVHHWVRYVG